MPRLPISAILRLAALLSAAALAVPALAGAAFYAGEPVDGPSGDLIALGGVDLARDGTGAVVYLRRDAGVPHVFASRLVDGRWTAPERLDPGLGGPSEAPVVAAGDAGRVAVAFVNSGTLFTIVRPAGAGTWPAPVPGATPAQTPSIDMSVNDVAYVAWTGAGDVHAARLERKGTAFTTLDAPLDIDPARPAGEGNGRPRIAVSADGAALVTWGEAGHVYARRLFELRLSQAPQDLTLDALDGHPGGAADSPDVDMEDDSSYAWVAFRQTFGGTTRVIARRLVGSAFDPPVDVGGGGFGAEGAGAPRVDLNGDGDGLFASASTASGTPFVDALRLDDFLGVSPLGDPSTAGPAPQPALGENGKGVVAWIHAAPGAPAVILGRYFEDGEPKDIGILSAPELGAVDPAAGFGASANRAGDVVVLYVQGSGGQRRLMSAVWDRPPAAFGTTTTSHWRRPGQLHWTKSFDLWGPLTYTVLVDEKQVAQSTTTSVSPPTAIPDGVHRWRVVAGDRHGQTAKTKPRWLRIDGTAPSLTVRVDGTRRAGRTLRFAARASDASSRRRRGAHAARARSRASGIDAVTYDFGDGSARLRARTIKHRFRHGTFTVTVTATDRAGNSTVVTKRLRIRR